MIYNRTKKLNSYELNNKAEVLLHQKSVNSEIRRCKVLIEFESIFLK